MPTDNYRLACELRDRLLAELNANETFKAFQHAQAIVNALAAAEAQSAAQPSQVTPTTNAVVVRSQRPGSLSSLILDTTADFLRSKGSRAASGEILKTLNARGIEVPGKKPTAVVASYLSHSPRFDNIRDEGGYGLPEWGAIKTGAAEQQ